MNFLAREDKRLFLDDNGDNLEQPFHFCPIDYLLFLQCQKEKSNSAMKKPKSLNKNYYDNPFDYSHCCRFILLDSRRRGRI